MTFIEVYQSIEFQNYCKSITCNYNDLMNDVAINIMQITEAKQKKIEQYMMQYSKRTAKNIFINQNRTKLDLKKYAIELKFQNLKEPKNPVPNVVLKDLKTPNKSIPAKMLLYSIQHGSIRKFANHMGVPHVAIYNIINQYKNEVKKTLSNGDI